jgi:hypothetical protein
MLFDLAKARQEAKTRERHVAKIREQFEAVQRNLGKYSLKTYDAGGSAAGNGQRQVRRRLGV